MACVSPPELDDRTLLIYLDGQASADTAAHIERCSHCRERAHRLARLEGRLTTQLYRVTCPSPHELGEYHLDMLPAAQVDAIRRHLAECPYCAQEIAQLQGYLEAMAADLDLEHSLLDRIKIWIARIVDSGTALNSPQAGALQPALAGLRGETSGPRIYQANDAQIAIEVQDDAEHRGRKVLLGLVTGIDTRAFKAHLWKAGRPTASVEIDELGNLIIPGVEPANYELILSGPDIEIHIQELPIGESQE
jgi:anti-sigma factor ChrR (cupin superfamily)